VLGPPSFGLDKVLGIRRIETNKEPSRGGSGVVGSKAQKPMRY
jgi:hypothetical protein